MRDLPCHLLRSTLTDVYSYYLLTYLVGNRCANCCLHRVCLHLQIVWQGIEGRLEE
uniref:Uncharacterized protein n=1 Tax=uncultured marine virus TaxID=186617 RepID=A0A0F7LB00_9VIRU|nr:hypothetical protein Isop_2447 [uncultured marine virus]